MKKTIMLIAVSAFFSLAVNSQTFNNVGTGYGGTPSALNGTNSQLQTAQDNQILFQGNNVFGNDAARNAIKVGIGVFPGTSPNSNVIADRLHLHDITASSVFARFSNSNTGFTTSNGFITGIDGTGNAIIKQFGNLPTMLYNNNIETMRLLASNNVGIGNSTDVNRLEITSKTGNPYFSSGSSSGLRFTNLLNTHAVSGTSGKVLSVDGSGDVILVTPIASGGATAANGLNTIYGSPDVELGGTLIRATTLDLNSNNLVVNNSGRFGIGGSITPGTIGNGPSGSGMASNTAKIVFDNGSTDKTQKIYGYTPSGFSSSYLYGLDVDLSNNTASGPSTGSWAIKTKVASEGSNCGVTTDVQSGNSNVGNNTGMSSNVVNGIEVIGLSAGATQDPAYQSNSAAAVWGVNAGSTGGFKNYGVMGNAFNGLINYGGYFSSSQAPTSGNYNSSISNTALFAYAADGPTTNIGVEGQGTGHSNYNALTCIGVYGHADRGVDVIGVKGEVPPNGGNTSGSNLNLAGYFIGDVLITGTAYYSGFAAITSDRAIKKNIKPIGTALEVLKKLSPKSYNLTNENCPQLDFTNFKTQYGLIAQEVEEVFPDIVYTKKIPAKRDTMGKVIYPQKELKGISYDQLISMLIKGTQEQQTQIAEQETKIAEQQTQMQALKDQMKALSDKMDLALQNGGKVGNSASTSRVDLSDAHIVVLEQNIPNPFFESTVINYILPQAYTSAKIVFTNNDGKVIKSVDLATLSSSSLTVYAGNLSNGLYSYTLYVDDKLIDTKKMVKD